MKKRLKKILNGLRLGVIAATIRFGSVKEPGVKEPTRQFDK